MSADVDEPQSLAATEEHGRDKTAPFCSSTETLVSTAQPLLHKWVALGSMTAGVILGVVLASSFGIGSDIRSSGGTLFAQGALGEALSRDLSGEAGPIGPSFWSKDGVFCRVFRRRAPARGGLTGIACRDAGAWRIRIVSQADPAAGGNVSGDLPAAIRGVMDNLIVGVPLDRVAEQQAQRQGWRAR
jgi:hypothetical protein